MNQKQCIRLIFLSLFLLILGFDKGIPSGFRLILWDHGIQLYKKEYTNGTPDFVQVIHLDQGASIRLVYGKITEERPKKGVYGGADPRILSQPLMNYWQEVIASHERAFCVTNGQFFYMKEHPTRLAFPLKVDGKLISDGWAIKQYPDQKLMLEIWDDRVNISDFSPQALYASTAPDIIVGLEETANKRASAAVGRTFMGIDDHDENGVYETVLILNTITAVQAEVAKVLRDFGADKVMMLDGGGSTQLICKGNHYIKSERVIPQAIAVIASLKQIEIDQSQRSEPITTIQPEQTVEAVINPGDEVGMIEDIPAEVTSTPKPLIIQAKDILWVPLIMLPLMILLRIIFFRVRGGK